MNDDLAKRLEDARPARRERARIIAAFDLLTEPTPPPAMPTRRPTTKRFSQRTVDRICRQIELGIADVKRDMPEVGDCDAAHDVAWSILHFYTDENPATRRAVCRRYGIDYRSI